MKLPILASLCYIHTSDSILLLERNKKKNDFHSFNNIYRYVGLGGKIEPKESPRENVIREIREEAKITVDPKFKGILWEEFYFRGTKKEDSKEKTFLVFIYTAFYRKEFPLEECNEGTLHWVEKECMSEVPMWEADYDFIKRLLESKEAFEVHHIYVDGKLKSTYTPKTR